MKNINKIVVSIIFSTSLLMANNISIDTIGLNIGSSTMDYSQKNHQGSIILGNEPDKTFTSYEIYTTLNGIYKKEDIKPYISYTYATNTDLKHQYLLVGLNKYYKHQSYKFYAGALVGYGQLNWKYNPLNTSKDNNIDANSVIGGIQGGISYPINDNLSVNLDSKYLLHNYETKLNPSDGVSSTIEHDSTYGVSFGISYRF